jgi:hypothetical protein
MGKARPDKGRGG